MQLGIDGGGLGCGQIGLRLVDQRLILVFLDLIEDVARFHVLAFGEQDLFDEALDPGPDLDDADGLDPADELIGPADPLHGRSTHTHRGRWGRCRSLFFLVAGGEQRHQQRQE